MPYNSRSNADEITSPPTKRNSYRSRKPTIWTREKIHKLIELYRASDCLWNHYSELYKNKDSRMKAIESICESLGISKHDYVKKIHNLRNQFNSELKKYERRTKEKKNCRWEHFETLMFLRPIIEPRPGYQPKCKAPRSAYEPKGKAESTIIELQEFNEESAIEQSISCEMHSEPVQNMNSIHLIKQRNSSPIPIQPRNVNNVTGPGNLQPVIRDQWDGFGELIANEFRNLNSEISRKKLKRKIMQIMLEVGEEDDEKYTG